MSAEIPETRDKGGADLPDEASGISNKEPGEHEAKMDEKVGRTSWPNRHGTQICSYEELEMRRVN